MLPLIKIALGPLLLLQGAWLRRHALRLPEPAGPRAGCISGGGDGAAGDAGAPLQLLVLGDSSAAGVGVDTQDNALARQLARDLATHTARPVAWQLLACSGIDTREAIALLHANAPVSADAVVIALGVNDVTAQRTPRAFAGDYERLLDAIGGYLAPRVIVICGLPPMQHFVAVPQPLRWYLGRCAARMDDELRRLCDQTPARLYLSFHDLPSADLAVDGFHPGPQTYRAWSAHVAHAIHAHLCEDDR